MKEKKNIGENAIVYFLEFIIRLLFSLVIQESLKFLHSKSCKLYNQLCKESCIKKIIYKIKRVDIRKDNLIRSLKATIVMVVD